MTDIPPQSIGSQETKRRDQGEVVSFARTLIAAACITAVATPITAPRAQTAVDTAKVQCPNDEQVAVCHSQTWGEFRTAFASLHKLSEQGQYDALETALLAAGDDDGRGVNSEYQQAAYAVLNFWARGSAEGDEKVPRNWEQALPRSPWVQVLKAMELRRKAAKLLGTLSRRNPPPEVRELFSRRVRSAQDLLAGVRGPVRDSYAWQVVELQLLAYSGSRDFMPAMSAASSRWPRNSSLYAAAVAAKSEMEDWEGVKAVIDLAAQRTKSTDGLEYYARLYATLGPWNMRRPTALDWGRMREGFDDWLKHDPSWIVRNHYAAYACVAGDADAFRRAMGIATADQVIPDAWLPGHPYDACVRWASKAS